MIPNSSPPNGNIAKNEPRPKKGRSDVSNMEPQAEQPIPNPPAISPKKLVLVFLPNLIPVLFFMIKTSKEILTPNKIEISIVYVAEKSEKLVCIAPYNENISDILVNTETSFMIITAFTKAILGKITAIVNITIAIINEINT